MSREYTYYFVEYRPAKDGERPVRIHVVCIPGTFNDGRGAYPQGISLDAFTLREIKRMFVGNTFKQRRVPFRFDRRTFRELSQDMSFEKRAGLTDLQDAKTVAHNGVWEFYRAIGYDHKTQKFTGIPGYPAEGQ